MSRLLNNNKALIFIIAILLIANITMLIFFLRCKPPQKESHANDKGPGFTEFLKKDIGFSADQLKEFDSLKKEHWKIAKPIFKGMNAAKDSFYAHISDTAVSDQFLMNSTDSIAKTQKQLDLQMFTHFRNIRKLCTESQKPLYDSLVQDVIKKMLNPYRRDIKQKKPNDAPEKQH